MRAGNYEIRSLDHPERTAVVFLPPRRQQAIVAFVAEHHRVYGYGPTFREIAAGVGLRAYSAAYRNVVALVATGELAWTPGCQRSIRLVT